jgi:tRNA (cmo5U34)-methyltransferase
VEPQGWSEDNSKTFIRLGEFLVPSRELQMEAICALLPDAAGLVIELSCGEGLLSERILELLPAAHVCAMDASPAMLEHAAARLRRFGDRQEVRAFDLAASDWRAERRGCGAVVSSLTVHHLDDPGKRRLYADVLAMLRAGGVFVVADLVLPNSPAALRWAEREWDRAVRERSAEAHAAFVRARWNSFAPGNNEDPTDIMAPIADHLRWLAEAGFVGIDVVWAAAGHAVYCGSKPGGRAPK